MNLRVAQAIGVQLEHPAPVVRASAPVYAIQQVVTALDQAADEFWRRVRQVQFGPDGFGRADQPVVRPVGVQLEDGASAIGAAINGHSVSKRRFGPARDCRPQRDSARQRRWSGNYGAACSQRRSGST